MSDPTTSTVIADAKEVVKTKFEEGQEAAADAKEVVKTKINEVAKKVADATD